MKISTYSHTEKVVKYSTNLLPGKLNLKENLLVRVMVQTLINASISKEHKVFLHWLLQTFTQILDDTDM